MVHRNHGIGKFLKLEKLAIGGESRDYLVVQYADGLLRVAADQLGSLGRYRATGDTPPELNRMGGTAWTRAKERARLPSWSAATRSRPSAYCTTR
ncbi:MAG: CarD family transcriptional regulator [Synechococcus sp.]